MAKVVRLKPKREFHGPPRRKTSEEQRRQRELSWAMYVTEGFIANLYHLRAVNSYTMRKADLAVVSTAIEQAEAISRQIHSKMNNSDLDQGEERRAAKRDEKLSAIMPTRSRRYR